MQPSGTDTQYAWDPSGRYNYWQRWVGDQASSDYRIDSSHSHRREGRYTAAHMRRL